MQQSKSPGLKEIRIHGTNTFPCALYRNPAHKKGLMVKHHWHEELEIIYFSEKGFSLEINMEHFTVTEEAFYFINPGELHSLISESNGNACENAVVFHPSMLSFDSCDATQLKLFAPIQNGTLLFPRCIPSGHPAFLPIRSAFEDVMEAFGISLSGQRPTADIRAVTDDLTSQLFIKASLLRILAILSQNRMFEATEKTSDKRVEEIKAVLTFVRENYREKIYLRDMAGVVNMNEQYFSRFFKKAIQRTPMEYLNDYRIRQAMRLLEETSMSVTEICLECGFNNMGNFLREFKKNSGTTPLQYRNQMNLKI